MEYFVSASGLDANTGTESSPFRTVQHAVDVAAPGDVVTIRGGSYAERVDMTGSDGILGKSGNAVDGPIIYRSYPGELAVMDGSGFTGWGGAFMSGKWTAGHRAMSYIEFRGIKCSHYPEYGVIFENNSETPAGSIGSKNITLHGMILSSNGNDGCYFEGGDMATGGQSSSIIVREVTAHHNGGHGIKFSGDAPGVLNRLRITNSSILSCESYLNGLDGVGDGIGIHVSTGCHNIAICGCVSYNNQRQGIAFHEALSSTIENCRAYGNGTRLDGNQDGIVVWSSTGIVVKKSTTYSNSGYGIYVSGDDGSISIQHDNSSHSNSTGQVVINGSLFAMQEIFKKSGWYIGPWEKNY